MSDFSPILVLQIKICIKPDRHGKCSNKIWETLSFWRDFFNNGAIWLQALICNRLNPRYDMQAVWLSIQRKLARTVARTCGKVSLHPHHNQKYSFAIFIASFAILIQGSPIGFPFDADVIIHSVLFGPFFDFLSGSVIPNKPPCSACTVLLVCLFVNGKLGVHFCRTSFISIEIELWN